MDVRKWLTNKLTGMRFLGEYGSTESLPSDYMEKITRELEPAITKELAALREPMDCEECRRFHNADHK